MRQQQWSAKNIFCKQKSIDDKPESSDSHNNGRKILRKQLSVDHLPSSLKHAPKVSGCASLTSPPTNLNNLFWQSSSQINEKNLRIVSASATKKRAQFAVSANNSINK